MMACYMCNVISFVFVCYREPSPPTHTHTQPIETQCHSSTDPHKLLQIRATITSDILKQREEGSLELMNICSSLPSSLFFNPPHTHTHSHTSLHHHHFFHNVPHLLACVCVCACRAVKSHKTPTFHVILASNCTVCKTLPFIGTNVHFYFLQTGVLCKS